MAGRPFREPLHPDIDHTMVDKLVRTFYTHIRADETLGPIFNRRIGDEWELHLVKMVSFWSSLTMLTGEYKGQPMPAHMRLKEVRPEHFDIWLHLFRQTAQNVCGPTIAPIFIDKAERVADSLKLGMFFKPVEKRATP